jgi:hypothetical protein
MYYKIKTKMNYSDKVKDYLLELGYQISKEIPEEQIFIISNEDNAVNNMVLDCEDNLLVIEQKLVDVAVDSTELWKQLLQANRRLVYGAYVLDETAKHLIFRDTLELENLDKNELEASLNSLALGLVENIDLLLTIAGEEKKD